MGQALQIPKCELNAAKNNKAHHTDEMSTRELIVRRGQDFTIILHFKSEVKQYLKNLRKFFLIAQTGPTPSKLNGTKNEFIISNLGNKKSWSAAVRERDLYSWTISVTTPASAVIGRYTFLLRLHTKFQHSVHKLGDFILLFNPWCPEDRVFLPNEAQRQEYVLSEDGIIYWGTESSIECYPWNFGQGDKAIIDICLQLLDVNSQGLKETNKGRAAWNDPVHLCRMVSAMLNCNDEKGILYGSWNGEYSGGTPPGKWKGSAPILHQWLSTNCQPVRYGQCWVFAAVMCTVLRCLGIPTRVVTNFTSAHDTGRKLTVDEYYNENGIKIKRNKNGSIWNFHVWNECWMAREDLPPGYDGWQALDATPQEKSEGSFQETEVFQKALEKINEHVQSQEEDTTANIPRSLAQLVPPLLLSIQPESSLSFGQDATIAVSIHNRTAAGKELQLTVGVQTLQYNGISHVPLWNEKFCFSLQTNEEKTITTRLFYSQYEKALTETNVLRVTALLQEKHMGIPMFTEQDMRVCRPQLSIQMDEKAQQYDPITARICFTNPLAESLEDCVLTAAGKGLIHGERTYRLGTIEAGGNLMHPVEFTPTQTGLRRLSVDMNCSKFQDLKSYKSLEVLAAEPNT
ncbi:erythrocyte membrane protein band 4.2-like isoform X5 [Rhinatrema bivittatum]|uniref:erythrocyte membrane protein band 4.2-like isoform X5 n=1 Tax=Rhinatrema bivittatum TaxID=194408 RepID=UPI00112CBA55|nr:erythrocyte membrane protein band 4.2-like isoform X5 [Rhinatrema bivittatum]